MTRVMLIASAAMLVGVVAHAQGVNSLAARPKAGPAFDWKCGPNGYAHPYYGSVVDNDHIDQPYEDASPCTPEAVIKAANAVGVARENPLGIKNVTAIMFSAQGTLAGKPGTKLDIQLNYVFPAARVAITAPGASSPDIRVANDESGWRESKEGVFFAPLPTAPADLTPFNKLTPFGAMRSVIEAEGNAKVTMVKGQRVISGASPYDGIPVTVTLDDKDLPVAMTAKIGKHAYAATFGGWSDKWESKYLVVFPEKMAWTVDGKPYADLTVTTFRSNPYVVFPIPASVTKASMPRPNAVPADVNGVWTPPAKRILPSDGFLGQFKPTGDTPRMADGHPDQTGDWNYTLPNPIARKGPTRPPNVGEPDQMVEQRSAYLNRPIYKPEYWDKVRAMAFSKVDVDPVYRCQWQGVPRQGPAQQIISVPKQVWTMRLAYAGISTRFIPVDGRKRNPDDYDTAYSLGLPLGRWEGDTFVVDTVGFNDTTWFGYDGYFHTDKMTVQERYTRKGNLLFYSFTVNDPDVLAEPWTSDTFVKELTTDPLAIPLQVENCTEDDTDNLRDLYERG